MRGTDKWFTDKQKVSFWLLVFVAFGVAVQTLGAIWSVGMHYGWLPG